MTRWIGIFAIAGLIAWTSCKKETAEAVPAAQAPAPAQNAAAGPHAVVVLKDGARVPGTIVASSQTDMVVAGDNGIESKIPLGQVKSVEYEGAPPAAAAAARDASEAGPPPPPPPPVARTYELLSGTEVSVRTNETIDSGTAREGQTFDAQVTRNIGDADGAVVIPRGARARIVIKSASKGGRFRGASDLVLDLQSVAIDGRLYSIDTADISRKGRSGIGANRRTAEFAGGGAALGAIIGAIAGGGKGAAIGAGAGAWAGAVTQILTKGGAIRVPVEAVLTFRLDRPLTVTAAE